MKILKWTLECFLRGLRFSGLLTFHVPPPVLERDFVECGLLVDSGPPAVLLPVGTQASDGRLSPAEERIWSELVAGLTGRGPSGE
jgi:hypothetical protein